ncbi:hypothetical protein ABFS83_10G105600 [Erythranthe nasuta]
MVVGMVMRGTIVEKLTEEILRDWSHVIHLFCICEAQRQIGETSFNEMSSRSPQIIRLEGTMRALLQLLCERASESLSAGTRLKEGCHINRRLLTLGTVIRKLSIDAQRVKNLCVAFRNFCEEKNFDRPNFLNIASVEANPTNTQVLGH